MRRMSIFTITPASQSLVGTLLLFGILYSILLLMAYHRRSTLTEAHLTDNIVARSWSNLHVAILVASFTLPIFITPVLLWMLGIGANKTIALVGTALTALLQILVIILIGKRRARTWKHDFGMSWENLKLLPLSLAIYLASLPVLQIATVFYHNFLENTLGLNVEKQEIVKIVEESSGWSGLGCVILVTMLAPLYEELVFRGILFPYFTRNAGLRPGIIFTSLLFAAIHFHAPSFVALFLLSAILCYAYWRTGSLWVSIGIHATFNGASTILSLLQH